MQSGVIGYAMEDAALRAFNYGGQRKSRGLRKARVSSSWWGRAWRTLLVAVCALSIARAIIWAGKLASFRGEEGAGGKPGRAGRRLPGEEVVLRARSDADSAFLDVTEGRWHKGGEELLQTHALPVRWGDGEARAANSVTERAKKRLVSRIGFGSCTSRVAVDQPIWVNGIIPSNIDAWIWCVLRIQ